MSAWFSRNTLPIAIVLIASGLVIGIFEVLDAFANSAPTATDAEEAGDDLEGAAALAGLIKVAAFLAVSGGITLLIRRRRGLR